MIPQTTLISYALSFSSFLIDSAIGKKVHKIILFGSVARGDYTNESDIDIFIDVEEKYENEIQKILALFKSSQIEKMWRLKGMPNDLSLKVGTLEQWSLRREVISSGILLYGKYNELPPHTRYYLLVRLDLTTVRTALQMRIWRKLYGYTQKVGKKTYLTKGLIELAGGKKLGKATFIVPMEQRKNVLDFLKQHRVKYLVNELWSDTL